MICRRSRWTWGNQPKLQWLANVKCRNAELGLREVAFAYDSNYRNCESFGGLHSGFSPHQKDRPLPACSATVGRLVPDSREN